MKDSVFELVKTMSKAEKRSFKLYAHRTAGSKTTPKFVALFDAMDSLSEYDEERIVSKLGLSKIQMPNLKAHLYRQILSSIRLSAANHSLAMRLWEQLDFARVLFDKGLYNQAQRILERLTLQAEELEQNTILLAIIDLQRQVKMVSIAGDMSDAATIINRRTEQISENINSIGRLSNLSVLIYALHQQLGYARSQGDLDLLNSYFKPKLDLYSKRKLSFTEQFYYYQAMAWYYYIRHNFAFSYRYARQWIALFDAKPAMKEVMYESYLRGYSRILEGMFLMRRHDLFVATLEQFERESAPIRKLNENAEMIAQQIIFVGKLNRCIMEGTFKEGLWLVRSIDSYIRRYAKYLSVYERMLLDYKIATIYFGDSNYARCMDYLAGIIAVKDPKIRRDLQCYARMLNLIASYEAGLDYNMEYRIKSAFKFIVRARDMNQMKREMFDFFRKISAPNVNIKAELKTLYERLKPYEQHPYERRAFYYLDFMSWIEAKITGRNYGVLVREKFEKLKVEN